VTDPEVAWSHQPLASETSSRPPQTKPPAVIRRTRRQVTNSVPARSNRQSRSDADHTRERGSRVGEISPWALHQRKKEDMTWRCRSKCLAVKALLALELATLVRGRKVTAREVVEGCLACCETINPQLGAFSQIFFEDALRQAHALDDSPKAQREGMPLLGVPIAHKRQHRNGRGRDNVRVASLSGASPWF
jgi:hypothetical protein